MPCWPAMYHTSRARRGDGVRRVDCASPVMRRAASKHRVWRQCNWGDTRMRVTIIGSGYVGLVTGACLAETGNTVMCVDKDIDKISLLKAGKIPFHEPGLAPLVEKNLRDRRLIFTTDLPSAVRHAPIIFLAAG